MRRKRRRPRFPRSRLAEVIARQWLRAARAPRMPCPAIHVGWYNHDYVHGHSKTNRNCLYLSIGKYSRLDDRLILLAHELAHAVCDREVRLGDRLDGGDHGPRFQWWLWRLLPRRYWMRANEDQWVESSSRHRTEYQPS